MKKNATTSDHNLIRKPKIREPAIKKRSAKNRKKKRRRSYDATDRTKQASTARSGLAASFLFEPV